MVENNNSFVTNKSNLYFQYLTLNETLYKFYQNNIDNVNITLLISLEKDYYEDKNMKLIMTDLRNLVKNKKILLNYKNIKEEFKVNKLTLFIGDILNRHMFYYKYCAKYLTEHNIMEESLIPLEVKEEFKKNAYIAGMQEGLDWFKKNIDALNLFSNEKVLTKDFANNISTDITTIFEETEELPKLDYVCYNHWLKHPKCNEHIDILDKICTIPNSVINRCYDYEADCFYSRLKKRGETPLFKDLFLKCSKDYLKDETCTVGVLNSIDNPNNFDIYYSSTIPAHFLVYKGKNIKNNTKIQELIQRNCFANNVNNYSQISIVKKDIDKRFLANYQA